MANGLDFEKIKRLVESGAIAELATGSVTQQKVLRILENPGVKIEDLYDLEEESEYLGYDLDIDTILDLDLDAPSVKMAVVNELNGTTAYSGYPEEAVVKAVNDDPTLLELAEIAALSIENPDDLDEFEMLLDDIENAVGSIKDSTIDEILTNFDEEETFIGLEHAIGTIEKLAEDAGALDENIADENIFTKSFAVNTVTTEADIIYPSSVGTLGSGVTVSGAEAEEDWWVEGEDEKPPATSEDLTTGAVKKDWDWDGSQVPELKHTDYLHSRDWLDYKDTYGEQLKTMFGPDFSIEFIWDTLNDSQKREIATTSWDNFDFQNFFLEKSKAASEDEPWMTGDPITDGMRQSIWEGLDARFRNYITENGWEAFNWDSYFQGVAEEGELFYNDHLDNDGKFKNPDDKQFIKQYGWGNFVNWKRTGKMPELGSVVVTGSKPEGPQYNSDWYMELSGIDPGETGYSEWQKFTAYTNSLGFEKERIDDAIEKGSDEEDLEFSLMLVNLWKGYGVDESLELARAAISPPEGGPIFPGVPFDPTEENIISSELPLAGGYKPKIHGGSFNTETGDWTGGPQSMVPIGGAFEWLNPSQRYSLTGFRGDPPGGVEEEGRYSLFSSLNRLQNNSVLGPEWTRYFAESTDEYKLFQEEDYPNISSTKSYDQWLNEKLVQIIQSAETADSKIQAEQGNSAFLGKHALSLMAWALNFAYTDFAVFNEIAPGVSKEKLYGNIMNAIQGMDSDGKKYEGFDEDVPDWKEQITLYLNANTNLRSEDKGILGAFGHNPTGEIAGMPITGSFVMPTFGEAQRGYSNRTGISWSEPWGQNYIDDILSSTISQEDYFKEAFQNTNPQLMGGVYDSFRDGIYDDAFISRFLSSEQGYHYDPKQQRYVGYVGSTDPSDPDIGRSYRKTGFEQDTKWYEDYINNRKTNAEDLYDNARSLADFLDANAWKARGEDYARETAAGQTIDYVKANEQIQKRFGLEGDTTENKRKMALLQTFNPLLYRAGSSEYTGAEAMLKQVALSATLPVGSTPQQRTMYAGMINQRYDEWTKANRNPNNFLKHILDYGRIVTPRSRHYQDTPANQDKLFEQASRWMSTTKDPLAEWNQYINELSSKGTIENYSAESKSPFRRY